jgi:hypothetical protein
MDTNAISQPPKVTQQFISYHFLRSIKNILQTLYSIYPRTIR